MEENITSVKVYKGGGHLLVGGASQKGEYIRVEMKNDGGEKIHLNLEIQESNKRVQATTTRSKEEKKLGKKKDQHSIFEQSRANNGMAYKPEKGNLL